MRRSYSNYEVENKLLKLLGHIMMMNKHMTRKRESKSSRALGGSNGKREKGGHG
jgi:hypothetical protein